MDNFLQLVYVGEIKTQCRFALNAVGALNHALRQLAIDSPNHRQAHSFFHSEVFRQTHSFLTHASNVSRLFWPALPTRRNSETHAAYEARVSSLDRVQRAVCLRRLYQLGDDHPLRNRTLRDHLEHYDERLDDWRKTSIKRNIASETIVPKNAIVGLDDGDVMRWFDPVKNVVRFRGEEFKLQELASAIDALLPQSTRLEDELSARQRNDATPQR